MAEKEPVAVVLDFMERINSGNVDSICAALTADHIFVDALGAKLTARPSPKFAILIGLRYLLLGAGAYVIVNFTSLSLPAALIGLFVPVAAVILEIIYELIYGA